MISCRRSPAEAEKEKLEAETKVKEQLRRDISDMISKHNAVSDWEKSIPERDTLEGFYTVDLEDALVRRDARPILIYTDLEDVQRQSDGYSAHFEDWTGPAEIRLILECDSEQVKEIMNRTERKSSRYAVIASISSITRPIFKLDTEPVSDVEAHIEVSSSHLVIANGRCLDLLFIGDYNVEK